jgi:hypothetical protein
MRGLAPSDRLERLLLDLYAPFVSEAEYLETLASVAREMADA